MRYLVFFVTCTSFVDILARLCDFGDTKLIICCYVTAFICGLTIDLI